MSIAPANKISDISHMTPKLIIVHVTSLKMDAQILETQMNGRDTILIASSKTKNWHQQEDCMMTLIMICLHDLPTRRSPEDVEEADAMAKENCLRTKKR